MKYHAPTPNAQHLESVLFSKFFGRIALEGWVSSFNGCVVALMEDALAFGALGNLLGTRAADLSMSPPASVAAAPSKPSRNNGSSSNSSSSSSSRVSCPDGVPYSPVRVCLALVTLLQTALTRLTATNGLETLAGSVGTLSLPLIGCTLAFRVRETFPGGSLPGRRGGGRWARTNGRTVTKTVGSRVRDAPQMWDTVSLKDPERIS